MCFKDNLLEVKYAISLRLVNGLVKFITHKEQYDEFGMEEFEDSNYMRWISLVSILEKNNYVCER
ncbi:DUF6630 family protein, partial [Defluviitalea phaphyphila]|uniref:DUF6630 family protein n=1 Tax=Defluviitalea phaphyphila TaxID=1473580 RepID=UPI001365EACB